MKRSPKRAKLKKLLLKLPVEERLHIVSVVLRRSAFRLIKGGRYDQTAKANADRA